MGDPNAIDALLTKGAGLLGALVSLGHVKGTWHEKAVMFVTGAASSYYGASVVAEKLSIPEGATGFFIGMFGMSIVSKLYELIQATSLSDFLPFLKKKD